MNEKNERHQRALEAMYLSAPINAFYRPTVRIDDDRARVEIDVDERLHHAVGAAHGSIAFKLLDDSAIFAVGSAAPAPGDAPTFWVTASFTVSFLKPFVRGKLVGEGRLVRRAATIGYAEARVFALDGGDEIARGQGVFARTKIPLLDQEAYRRVATATTPQ